jgi:TPR repeat protein
MFTLGQYYLEKLKLNKAMEYFHAAAKQDDAQAYYQLAVAYYDGIGVDVDVAKGFEYMMTVAENGCPHNQDLQTVAQFRIGQAYYQGYGAKQSYEKAIEWLTRAAKAGNSPGSVQAQNMLGMYYSRHESQNLKTAFSWHIEAALNGSADSMAAVGQMLLDGHGCKRNDEEGLEWLRKAAHSGNVYGTALLALNYFRKKLYSKAIECANRICDIPDVKKMASDTGSDGILVGRGAAVSCFVLGTCHRLGRLLPQDAERAAMYYKKAAHYDNEISHALHQKAKLGNI